MIRLCATRPFDWWDLGDEGNRLALLFCSVCPSRLRCLEGDPRPHGVIRAGVAYADNGRALPLCRCGYPNRHQLGGRGVTNPLCHRCSPPWPRRWDRSRKRYWAEYYVKHKAGPTLGRTT